MSRTSTLFLRVKEADEADYHQSVVRIHETNRPRNINWGDYINLSLDKKHWITCKLEAAGDIGVGKIYISIFLRRLLNKHAAGNQIVQLGEPLNFYIKKAFSKDIPLPIVIGIIAAAIIVVAFLVYLLDLVLG